MPVKQLLRIKEVDGSPNVPNVTEIDVQNTALTDNGSGRVSIDIPTPTPIPQTPWLSDIDADGNDLNNAGTITGDVIIKLGGTSAQFLKADGSVDSSVYLTSSNIDGGFANSTYTVPQHIDGGSA